MKENKLVDLSMDFAVISLALKECYETEYWLELFVKANIISNEKVKPIIHTCGEIRRMLIASVNTLKSN